MTLNEGQYVQITQNDAAVGQPDHVEQADRRVRRPSDHVDRSLLRRSRRADARAGAARSATSTSRRRTPIASRPASPIRASSGSTARSTARADLRSARPRPGDGEPRRPDRDPHGRRVHREQPGHGPPVRDVHVHDAARGERLGSDRTGSAAGAIPTSSASCRRRSTSRTTCSSPIRPTRSPADGRAPGRTTARSPTSRSSAWARRSPAGSRSAATAEYEIAHGEARRSLQRPARLQQRRPRHGLDAAVRRVGVGLGQRGHEHRLGQLRLSGRRSVLPINNVVIE